MNKALLVSSALVLSLASLIANPYNIDKTHSQAGFQVTHMLISDVNGAFNDFSGKIDFDEKSKQLKVLEGEVIIKSIDTKNTKRDDHLNAPDFFDSTKFPKATLVATQIQADKITADLTIRGITKSITFDYTLKGPIQNPISKKQTIALKLEGKINRKDFGIGEKTPDKMVSDEVIIKIQIEAVE